MAEVCTFHFGEERDGLLWGGWGSLSRKNGILRIGYGDTWGNDGGTWERLGVLRVCWGTLERLGVFWGG